MRSRGRGLRRPFPGTSGPFASTFPPPSPPILDSAIAVEVDVLFLHQNFPAQFGPLARSLAATAGMRVAAVTHKDNRNADFVMTARYAFEPIVERGADPVAIPFRLRVKRGQAAAEGMAALKAQGFSPEVIIGQIGWGETLFAREIFPKARLIAYSEFYYSPDGPDIVFDPEFPLAGGLTKRFELRARNASILMGMDDADIVVSPTRWQASQHPAEYASKMRVLHDGIETDQLQPDPGAVFDLPGGSRRFAVGDEVATFVNRDLEPYRGVHVFLRALPEILARRPKAHVVIVGSSGVSYGAPPPEGRTWKDVFLDEVRDRLPKERVHFVGRLPFAKLADLLRVSAAHVYLTYPFVLSWSMLQAMSLGVPLIASRTAPVTEVVSEAAGNGRLVDFFDRYALVEAVVDTLANPRGQALMRAAARRTIVERYDLAKVCLPQWRALIGV